MGLYVGGVGVGVTDAAGAIAATDVADRLKLSGRAAEVPTASCLAVSPGASRMALPSSFVEPVGGAAVAAAAAVAAIVIVISGFSVTADWLSPCPPGQLLTCCAQARRSCPPPCVYC